MNSNMPLAGQEKTDKKADDNNVLCVLQKEHKKVEGLFRQLRVRRQERASLVKELARELVSHNLAEEETFYKWLGTSEPQHEDKMKVEHVGGALHLLHLMEESDVMSTAWELKLSKLALAISHHVDDEETTMHNLARELYSEEQLQRYGEAFKQKKQELLSSKDVGSIDHVKEIAGTASLLEKTKDMLSEMKSKVLS